MTATGRDRPWIRAALRRKFYDIGRRVPPRNSMQFSRMAVQLTRSVSKGSEAITVLRRLLIVKRICTVIDRIAEGIDVPSVSQGGGEA